MVEDERRPGVVAENEVVEIGWIVCHESSIYEGDFEDGAIMDR